jgi:hypothetical protein
MKRRYPEIGTVSHGTMRPQDLIPAFLSVIETFDPDKEAELARSIPWDRENGGLLPREDSEWWESDDCSCLLNDDIFEAMQAIAPPFCYFGSTEGDGSDYGFWPIVPEPFEDSDNDIERCDELPENPTRDYALVVSDHGNATLYERICTPRPLPESGTTEWREVWSIA